MGKEDISLLISIVAVCVAGLALGWNIYRDIILKAKIKVSLHIVTLIQSNIPEGPQYIRISATNFGPGRVKIMNIHAMNAPWKKRLLQTKQYGVITPDNENLLSGKIPSWIEEGDKLDLLLPYTKICFLDQNFSHVGVSDFYGRSHWAPKQDVLEARRQWEEDFQKT